MHYRTCRCVHTCAHTHTCTHVTVCMGTDLEGHSRVLAGPKGFELSVKVRRPLPVLPKFFSRVFLCHSEQLFMCYLCSLDFHLKASSGLIYEKDRNWERACVCVCVFACPAFAQTLEGYWGNQQWLPVESRRKGKMGIRLGVKLVTSYVFLSFLFLSHVWPVPPHTNICMYIVTHFNEKSLEN